MKIYKKFLGFFALAVLLNPNTLTLDASTFSKENQIQNKEILYDITAFTTEKNTLNLIINQLFKEDNTLFIDAYFLNTTENTITNPPTISIVFTPLKTASPNKTKNPLLSLFLNSIIFFTSNLKLNLSLLMLSLP